MTRAHLPWVLIAISLSTAAITAFLTRGSGAAAKQEARAAAEVPPAAAEAPKAEAPAAVKHAETPAPAEAPAVSQAAKTAIDERGHLLETVGCLTSAHYFQTYLNIGFIADGKAKGAYTDRDARWVLDSVLSLLRSTDQKVEALDRFDLDRGDRERLEQLRAVSALLHQQGKELQAYWDGGKEEHATKYESLRQTTWASLSKLMGIGQ
jgi:hypothetical protein